MSLFLSSEGVNENRKILLCKTIGGDTEICEIKNRNTARGEDSNFVRVGPRILAARGPRKLAGLMVLGQCCPVVLPVVPSKAIVVGELKQSRFKREMCRESSEFSPAGYALLCVAS
jgi:hypothetical protein